MATTELTQDLLESHGFKPISELTFDGLFMKGW